MKLWTFYYHDDSRGSGQASEWFTSKRAAQKRARELDRERGGTESDYFRGAPRQRDVPTTRAALADWLTRYEP